MTTTKGQAFVGTAPLTLVYVADVARNDYESRRDCLEVYGAEA